MNSDRLDEIRRALVKIRCPLELDGFKEQLGIQDELDGVTRHHIEQRRKELRGKRK